MIVPKFRSQISDFPNQDSESTNNSFLNDELLRRVVETSADGFLICDRAGKILDVNDSYCQISGYRKDELLKLHLGDLKATDQALESIDQLAALTEKNKINYETEHKAKNGKTIDFAVNAAYLNASGNCILAFYRDVTAVKSTEKTALEREKFISAIVENAPFLIYLYDNAFKKNLYVNRRVKDLFGYTIEEILALGEDFLYQLMHASDHERVKQRNVEIQNLADGEVSEIDYRIAHKKGEWRWLRTHDTIFRRDETGKPVQILGFAEDITKHKQAEVALRQSEERYRVFIKQSGEGIWCFELEKPIPVCLAVEEQVRLVYERARISECNDALAEQYGFQTAPELLDKGVDNFMVNTDSASDVYLQKFVESNYRLNEIESHVISADGKDKYFSSNLIGIVEDEKLVRIWGTQRDISVWKQIEILNLESENRFREVADYAPVLIRTIGIDKKCNYFNKRWLDFTGKSFTEEMCEGWIEELHPEDAQSSFQIFEAAFDSRQTFEMEYRLRRHDGEYRWVLDTGNPRWQPDGSFAGYISSCLDVTARKQAEQALLEHEEHRRQTQKIEAIGRLAGGLAHDFNNFLAIIMLHIDMLNLQLPADSPFRFRISEIKTATNTAAGMVRQLLAFSRKQMLQPRSVILNQVVYEASKIFKRLIREDVELEVNLDPNLGVCSVDPDQMMQVLMNLIVNARDAMPKGGKLSIQTSNVIIDSDSPKHKAQPAGSYIQLNVTDTGIGMDTETQEKIFEPFFTTKPAGKGTGLGLATVYGIVKQSGGFIWVNSTKNVGTSFTIQFPRVQDLLVKQEIEEKPDSIPSGKETILLVEDEELIRRAAHELLNVLGYSVLVAENGQAALQLAQIFDKPIHLLLTDVVMPKMNGRELAEKMKEVHPETTVLFMSGYTDDIITRHGVLEEGTNFIEKPFAPSILAIKIREVLEAKHN